MWLFAIRGFFSIVEHDEDSKYLLVRARVKGDIERYWPDSEVERTDDADYLYRAKIRRPDVERAILQMVKDINYTSFKGSLEEKQRYVRWYRHVSEVMKQMQEDLFSAAGK